MVSDLGLTQALVRFLDHLSTAETSVVLTVCRVLLNLCKVKEVHGDIVDAGVTEVLQVSGGKRAWDVGLHAANQRHRRGVEVLGSFHHCSLTSCAGLSK